MTTATDLPPLKEMREHFDRVTAAIDACREAGHLPLCATCFRAVMGLCAGCGQREGHTADCALRAAELHESLDR